MFIGTSSHNVNRKLFIFSISISFMKIWALILILIIFSLCISESPQETPKTTQEPTETPTYTPHATTPSPTAPTPTTPAPVDYERNICEERQLPENLIQFVKGLEYDNNANDNEIYVADTAKDFIEKGITPEITEELFNLSYKKGGKEDLVQNIDTSIFRKIIEDNLIENHEIRLIDKSFTYSDLQSQLKTLDDKASENFLKTYKVVLDKSETARTESEKFLYEKIDEHLPEFEIGEDGFLYYGKEKLFKVDDKNLYVKWLDKASEQYKKNLGKIAEVYDNRDCHWQYGFDKEFSECYSKFIGEKTGIPWNTKYYSVEPIENNAKLFSSDDATLTLDFDEFGFNGLGYEQLLDIYNTHTKNPRLYASIDILKNKDQLFNHYICLYDRGTHINDTGDPNIIFSYPVLYKENDDILYRSFAELYYATEFFWDYMNLACLLGPKEQ